LQQRGQQRRFDPAVVMIVVTFVGYSVSFMDRQIVSVLIEPIKAELHIPDGQMGMLTGLSFALFYCVMSLPIATLSDRISRKRIIVTAMAFWSVMTALFGFARNYGELFVARMAVGGGEAAFAPAVYSMVADYYPPHKRGAATGIIAAGSMVGATCGLVLGGYVAEHAGWRAAMKVAAVPGLILAVVYALVVREPRRELSTGAAAMAQKVPRFSALARVPAYLLIVAAANGGMFVLFACVHWFPAYLMRTHHMNQAAVGTVLGPVLGGAGVAAMIISGFATDLAARKDARWTTWTPAIATLAGVPLLALSFWADDRTVAIACFGAAYFAVMFQCTPIVAAIQGLVLPNLRARASAVFMLSTTLVGSGAGPTLAGYLSQIYEPAYGHDSLRYALLTLTPVLLVSPLLLTLAAPWFVRGRRAAVQDMATHAEGPA
jgi:predicted MFS family arabinose efflux permease